MPYFLVCLAVFGATVGAAPGNPPQLDSSMGYALEELSGPYVQREDADAATCTSLDAVRLVVQATSPDDVPARLQDTLFPTSPDAR